MVIIKVSSSVVENHHTILDFATIDVFLLTYNNKAISHSVVPLERYP
jgi:hypothetical protein